jgi:hypothetical protein
MRGIRSAFCLVLAAVFAVGFAATAVAASSADCGKGPPAWWNAPRVSYTTSKSASSGFGRASTHEFAAQRRPQVYIYPRHRQLSANAKRHCESWLAKEYRVSGTVIVPRMRCWWQ